MTVIHTIDKYDAHDRYQELSSHGVNIGKCCQDLIDQRPFGDYPFYIFAHMRTHDNGVDKILIWQPRLTKPKAQSNSMLFKAYPGTDVVKVLWMLPAPELWGQYTQGLITENKLVSESIHDFMNNRKKLEEREDDDMSEEQIKAVYKEISQYARQKKAEEESIKKANPQAGKTVPFSKV
jgi:hypothetical protein